MRFVSIAARPLDTALWLVRGARVFSQSLLLCYPRIRDWGRAPSGFSSSLFPASWWSVLLGTLDRNCKQKKWLKPPCPPPSSCNIHLLLNQFSRGLEQGCFVTKDENIKNKQVEGEKTTRVMLYHYIYDAVSPCASHDNNTRITSDKI